MTPFAKTLAAAVLLAALPGLTAAQETEPAPEPTPEAASPRGFSFHLDPLSFGALATDLDTGSAKFEEYRDLGSGFWLDRLHLSGESADGETLLDFTAVSAGRDDGRYTLALGTPGRYQLTLDYNKIPHRFGNGARLLWTETRPGVYEIPDSVQTQLQTAVEANRTALNYNFLDNLLAPYLAAARTADLGLVRDRSRARLDVGQLGRLAWAVEVTHEQRKGNRPFGASFGFNSVTEVPEPIDYDTQGAELSAEWTGSRSGLRFGYRASRFENHVDTLIWDNPFRAVDSTDPNAYQAPSASSTNGASRGIADLAPDNRSDVLFLSGRTRFGRRGWAQTSVSWNRMQQDDPLLPYTLNTAIRGVGEGGASFLASDPAALPARSADAEVEVMNLAGDVGTRFGDDWGLTFRYRYYDYDNQSPRIAFPGYVRFQSAWLTTPRITVPYAWKTQDLTGELTWDVTKASRLVLSAQHKEINREFQEVESAGEDVWKLSFDTRLARGLTLRASTERGDRDIDGYHSEAAEESFVLPTPLTTQPGLRKFSQAARRYGAHHLTLQWLPAEAWNVFVGASRRKDDYDESLFGLVSDDIFQVNAEVGYTPREGLDVYAFAQRADRESFQRGRQSAATPSTNPLDDWTATFEEINDLYGLGLTAKLGERWSAVIEGRYSISDGAADLASPPGGTPDVAVGFDNYEDIELGAFLAEIDYQWTPRATVGLLYRFEEYTIDSFILQGLRNYLPGALLLHGNNGDYRANVYGLRLKLVL